jgi:hypothetical protein
MLPNVVTKVLQKKPVSKKNRALISVFSFGVECRMEYLAYLFQLVSIISYKAQYHTFYASKL